MANTQQDFRSQNGLYNLVKEQYPNAVVKGRDLFDSVLFSDPISTSIFYTFITSLRSEVLKVKDTTATHKFIRTLAESGRLLRCYTQNIDGLEERENMITDMACGRGKRKRQANVMDEDLRSDEEKGCQVVQLHGELRNLRCTRCQLLTGYSVSSVNTLLSGTPPNCPACQAASDTRQNSGKRATNVGTLRPNVVLYGEEHPRAELVGSLSEADIRAAPDMMIILGTSLRVHGLKRIVKEFAKAVHAKGGSVIFVNNTAPTPESIWGDVIDYHVAMDCDAWVADVKVRRANIWERQTQIKVNASSLKVVKKFTANTKENGAPELKAPIVPCTPSNRRKVLGAASGNFSALPPTPPSTQRRVKTRNPLEAQTPGTPLAKRRKIDMDTPPITPTAVRNRRIIAVEIVTPKKKTVVAPPAEGLAFNEAAGATPAKVPSPKKQSAALEPIFLIHEDTPEALPVTLNSAEKPETTKPVRPVGTRKSARLSIIGA